METTRRRRALPAPDPQESATRRNTAPATASRASGTGGWGGMKSTLAEGGGFMRPIKFADGEDPIVVKFLDAEPFDSFRSHWIEKTGRKSYRHLTGEVCPLCDPFGDQPSATAVCFNVVSFEDPAKPVFAYVQAGARLARKLEAIAGDRRFEGLNDPRLYVAVSATGKGTNTEYQAEIIKVRDLEDDWDITPLDDAAIAAYREKAYPIGSSVEEMPTEEELRELVRELTK